MNVFPKEPFCSSLRLSGDNWTFLQPYGESFARDESYKSKKESPVFFILFDDGYDPCIASLKIATNLTIRASLESTRGNMNAQLTSFTRFYQSRNYIELSRNKNH